jgi:hypothetical protein
LFLVDYGSKTGPPGVFVPMPQTVSPDAVMEKH